MIRFACFFCPALVCFASLLPGQIALGASTRLNTLPLTFEQNRGQASAQFRYISHRDGLTAGFYRDGVDFSLPVVNGRPQHLRLQWIGADASPIGGHPLDGKSNYLIGADPARWVRGVSNYTSVDYTDLYRGISLTFYGNGRDLEHDFQVHAGADPSQIAFRMTGAESLHLNSCGDLEISLAAGTVVLRKPVAYQIDSTGRQPVDARFTVFKDKTVRFRVGAYDSRRMLVIDPVFGFSTYLAGTGRDQIAAVATDRSGNIYVTGNTQSTDFPKVNPLQPQLNGCGSVGAQCQNAFVAKLDPTGHRLIYSTYLGGSLQDRGAAITVDANDNAIVSGIAMSPDFPHTGAIQSPSCAINNGCFFLASLKPDGSGLNYSGMIGGSEALNVTGDGQVAVDASGNAYLTGVTDDSNFPVTPGTLSTTVAGYPYTSMFVLKVDPTGKLLYSTVVPGTAPQNPASNNNQFDGTGIAVDAAGEVTVAGTASLGLPTTPGVAQSTFPNDVNIENATAGFVLQLNATASALKYATYLPGTDTAGGLAVDGAGNSYITGRTSETNLPVSQNAYQTHLIAGQNCTCNSGYVLKLNAKGTAVLAASYLSGTPPPSNEGTSFTAIALDGHSNVFVGGMTGSADFPMQNPFVSELGDTPATVEMVLAEMNPGLSAVLFGSFLSATDGTYPGSTFSGLAVDPGGNLIAVGTTYAGDFPTTAGSVEPRLPPPANPGSIPFHSFVAKLDMATPAASVCLDYWAINFGMVPAKTPSSQLLHVTNCGNAPLKLASIVSSDPTVVVSQNCGTIAPGTVCPVTLTYTPRDSNQLSSTLTLSGNTAISPQIVSLTGQGQAPNLSPQFNPVPFGHLLVGTQGPATVLFVTNTGNAPLKISSVHISGSSFSISQNNCMGNALAPGAPCVIGMVFAPVAAGSITASLTISSNDPVNPQFAIGLIGTGDSAYSVPAISSIGAGTVPINNGTVPLQVSGSNFYPASVVQVNGAPQSTTFVSNGSLQATIAASALTQLGEIPVTVVNPSPGGGPGNALTLTQYQSIPLTAIALAYDPVGKLLYAAVPAASASNPNTIIPIDPTTGTVQPAISVGNDPNDLAVSADGAYLYVALRGDHALQRINLQTQTVERTFPLPVDPSSGNLTVQDMKVVPGSSKSIVVALSRNASPAEDGAALFNDSGLVNYLPNDYSDHYLAIDSFTFTSSPSTIYALPFPIAANPQFFTEVSVDSSGLHYSGTGPGGETNQQIGSIIASDGTLLYTNAGEVWNPATQQLLGTYKLPSGSQLFYTLSVVPDPSTGRTFFLDPYSSYAGSQSLSIEAFDPQNYSFVGVLPFTAFFPLYGTDLVRWGTDGFAFDVYDYSNPDPSMDQIVILRSSLGNQPSTNPVPYLSWLLPSSITAGNQAFSLTAYGNGFVSGSVVWFNGSALQTTYVSGTQLTAALPASVLIAAGTVQVMVKSPAPGGGSSNALPFTIQAAGPNTSLSAMSLDFGNMFTGESSAAEPITLTNSGTAALNLSGIAATGDFTETNTCESTLPIGASCEISVVFTPAAAGQRNGTLTVSSNAVNGSQTVALRGTGVAPFTIGAANGGSTSATVSAGNTATYNLSIAGAAQFSGKTAFTCSGAPQNATCSINPTSLTLAAGASANFTVSVSTGGSQTAALPSNSTVVMAGFGLLSLLTLPLLLFARRRLSRLCALGAMAAFMLVGCGGGNHTTGGQPTGPLTPAGTYTLTVTASATTGAMVQQQLTLIVQ